MRPQHNYDDITRCDNCGARRKAGTLDHISDPGERLYAGEVVPAGQCPDCGALAHLIEDSAEQVLININRLAGFADAVIRLLATTDEWSSDTLDEISMLARNRDLAHLGDDGFFKAGPKPQPFWETLTEWTDGDCSVKWEYRYIGDGEAEHQITYGKQVKGFRSDIDAAKEFGYCVRHSLECIGAFSEGPR